MYEYSKEIDLLYRLVFERGLVPTPETFKDKAVQNMAKQLYDAHVALIVTLVHIETAYKNNKGV